MYDATLLGALTWILAINQQTACKSRRSLDPCLLCGRARHWPLQVYSSWLHHYAGSGGRMSHASPTSRVSRVSNMARRTGLCTLRTHPHRYAGFGSTVVLAGPASHGDVSAYGLASLARLASVTAFRES